jgi:hypothetical protein
VQSAGTMTAASEAIVGSFDFEGDDAVIHHGQRDSLEMGYRARWGIECRKLDGQTPNFLHMFFGRFCSIRLATTVVRRPSRCASACAFLQINLDAHAGTLTLVHHEGIAALARRCMRPPG